MSHSPQPQARVNTQLSSSQGPVGECASLSSVPKSVTPSKRPDDDDDDIQFISSKPVKRQKMNEYVPEPPLHQHNSPPIPLTPILPTPIPPPELRDSDRRVSTGMVGLPSDINVMELTSALRGVSLPVLEKFVLNQPSRKPRPLSPPELSPKQLPHTIAPAMLRTNINNNGPGNIRFPTAPMTRMPISKGSAKLNGPTPNPQTPSSMADGFHVLNTPVGQVDFSSPALAKSPKEADLRNSTMPPPPLPRTEASRVPRTTSSKTPLNVPRSDTAKHPCQVCIRMQHHANISQAQGLPMLHHTMSHHMIPQMACHPPYSQHLHPQVMTMGPNGMHAFGPGFSPVMMPINGSNFAALPSHMTKPVQMNQQSNGTTLPSNSEKADDQPQPLSSPPPPPPPPVIENDEYTTASNPVKPPSSLIQPTYRKPSPNLIVDVAETCQEKFPFEEVAKRHNVPVEKVFDVFAAIIQVPLLRCPTDRRRAGRLATTRVKDYARAKKAIQETNNQNTSDPKEEVVVKPSDVADHLGQVEPPDGFHIKE
ncbi:hypothetical protein F4804DRAFT_303124 [Jackrogersella minutella]|nr:hypothetical protein F4804DRAFT_303124 [Jackrogersella minutella]